MLLKHNLMKRERRLVESFPLISFQQRPVRKSLEPCSKKPCNDSYPNPFGLDIFGYGILVKDTMGQPNTSAFANDDDLTAIPSPPRSSEMRRKHVFSLRDYHVCDFSSYREGSVSLYCLKEDFNRTYGSSMKITEAFWLKGILIVKVMTRCNRETVDDNLQQVLNIYAN